MIFARHFIWRVAKRVTAVPFYNYDVVVVGAGPAGASAARAAAKPGVNVLLVDARNHPGSPVQCAEFVPREVKHYVPLVKGAVIQNIDSMDIYINDKRVSSLASSGYMLNRAVFDQSLVDNAMAAGTEFWPGTKAISKEDVGLIVFRNGKDKCLIQSKVIIGADGPRSTVGHWMKSENQKYMVGLQYDLPLCHDQKSIDIYLKPEYEGGYAWLFPKGERANVGIGVSLLHKDKLPLLMKSFINSLAAQGKLTDTQPEKRTGGLIPVGGPLAITQAGNMLLAGDAGGHTHSVTGGGIMTAIVAGEISGKSAAQAVVNDDIGLLSLYPKQWKSFLGRFLDRAARRREDMDTHWTDDQEQFEALINRTWIGSSEVGS